MMFDGTKVLIIDDDPFIIQHMTGHFEGSGLNIGSASDGKEGLKLLLEDQPDVVIIDYRMPGMDGLALIKAIRSVQPEVPVIVMTGASEKEVSVAFLKEGAYRYLEKPLNLDEVGITIQSAVQEKELKSTNQKLDKILKISDDFPEIIGESPAMVSLYEMIDRVSQTNATVLIQGESGTGKELIAKAIHQRSERADKPFIRFNCAAFPETLIESELFGHEKGSFTGADDRKLGRFELAQSGTMFFDELGELSLNMQVKLLRVIQEREFERVGGTSTIQCDVRIVCATNRNLEDMVGTGKFREDLFYRINTFPLQVPPLREREGDVPILATQFLKRFAAEYNKSVKSLSKTAIKKMVNYEWKGNVRELENVVSRAVILAQGPTITDDLVPLQAESQSNFVKRAMQERWTEQELVKHYATEMYKQCGFNKNETARVLNLNIKTLNSRLTE